MESPIRSFLSWHNSLPVTHRRLIAMVLFYYVPWFGKIDPKDIENVTVKFEGKLKEYIEDKRLSVGIIMTIRACIDFFIIRKYGSEEGWAQTKEFYENTADHYSFSNYTDDEKEELLDISASSLRSMSFERMQWRATCNKWQSLVSNELSDVYIGVWMNG